jgi:hypothetical protein
LNPEHVESAEALMAKYQRLQTQAGLASISTKAT